MKKQAPSESTPLNHHLQQFTDDHPLMEWLQNYGKIILLSLAGLLVLLFIIYRAFSSSTAKAEANYYEAAHQFSLYQKNDDREAFNKLQALLNSHPELHPKYDGQLAQLLINRNAPQEAEAFANLAFNRVRSDDVPYYEEFAAITLLISKGELSDALKGSKELKQKMLKDATAQQQERAFGDLLFAYNLLRIAVLEGKVGAPEEELAAWSEWNTYASASTNSASIKAAPFYTLDSLFSEGQLTLNGYIKSRQAVPTSGH